MKNYLSKILVKKVRFISWVFLFFFLIYLLAACATQPPLSPPDIKPPIYGNFYKPDSLGPFPAVVLLHGGHGIFPRYNVDAERLAQNGYAALVLDYYQETGGIIVYGVKKRLKRWHAYQQTVYSTFKYLKSLPEIDNKNLGMIGYSNGVALALSTAGNIPEVKAVVDFYGNTPTTKNVIDAIGMGELSNVAPENYLDNMPPVLILHGEDDSAVPIEEAKKLYDQLRELEIEVELIVYPGAEHGFDNEDAQNRVLNFLNQHLKK